MRYDGRFMNESIPNFCGQVGRRATLVNGNGFAEVEVHRRLTPEDKVHLLRQMLRIRRFEPTALKAYQTGGQMGGFLHLYTGRESVAVGTISLCGDDDHIITGYRQHGQPLDRAAARCERQNCWHHRDVR